jgi:hypothetical protein
VRLWSGGDGRRPGELDDHTACGGRRVRSLGGDSDEGRQQS